MAQRTEEIVKAAVQLPEKERVRVVEELLANLEPEPDEDVDAAWAAEVERRSREIKEGTVRRPLEGGKVKVQKARSCQELRSSSTQARWRITRLGIGFDA